MVGVVQLFVAQVQRQWPYRPERERGEPGERNRVSDEDAEQMKGMGREAGQWDAKASRLGMRGRRREGGERKETHHTEDPLESRDKRGAHIERPPEARLEETRCGDGRQWNEVHALIVQVDADAGAEAILVVVFVVPAPMTCKRFVSAMPHKSRRKRFRSALSVQRIKATGFKRLERIQIYLDTDTKAWPLGNQFSGPIPPATLLVPPFDQRIMLAHGDESASGVGVGSDLPISDPLVHVC
ncbi:hypothetical protein C8R45DRAFT_935458 [Mycena sanguinolenta]|nr:hypothetical protein C8R45DRAFT_935458 [Mycena sanguinolenta]